MPDQLFGDGVGMTVYQYVGGVPRLINTLMDASLSQASAKNMDTLTADTIHEVAKDLGWKPLSRGQMRPREGPIHGEKADGQKAGRRAQAADAKNRRCR